MLESLVATLNPYWEGARVLDLFAGTGTLAKAALAQGAAEVVCVEAHPHSEFPLPGRVVKGKLPDALKKLEGTFDLILADPPYNDPAGPATASLVAPLLNAEGYAVFEHHHKENYPDVLPGLSLHKRKRFGETALSYYTREPNPNLGPSRNSKNDAGSP